MLKSSCEKVKMGPLKEVAGRQSRQRVRSATQARELQVWTEAYAWGGITAPGGERAGGRTIAGNKFHGGGSGNLTDASIDLPARGVRGWGGALQCISPIGWLKLNFERGSSSYFLLPPYLPDW